ncbi:zinc knuckle [Trichuris suis]|nr:zinc knuckle [Trichuris suis]
MLYLRLSGPSGENVSRESQRDISVRLVPSLYRGQCQICNAVDHLARDCDQKSVQTNTERRAL